MLARFFIDRPIFAWVISIVITLIGGLSAYRLPIAQYPNITPPTVQVTCTYPGASARVVADSVAAPIEQQVNGVEGMLYMSSQCGNDGTYTLNITFELGVNLDMAQVLVQNRVTLATPQLPQEVQAQGVSTKKRSPSILLVVNLFSPDSSRNALFLSNFATIQIRDELARIRGVGDITFLGQRDYSMRVWLDPERMASRGLTTNDVIASVRAQNVQVAAGQIGRPPIPEGQEYQYTLNTLGRLQDEDEFKSIILKTGETTPQEMQTSNRVVRIADVADVALGAQQYDQNAQLDGLPSVGVAVFQLPGSNALDVADNIKKRMTELRRRFPEGVEYRIAYDTTPFIRESVNEVFKTLRDAVLLVAIVVLFFLQDWKAMILPMIDVPVSLIGTFAVMAVVGFTLNNLTLFGLVLAIGIVVDDAIVVLENVERLIATGLDARTATIRAMDEVTGPILAITLVLCSVFVPATFIPGISGQFYRQFALTIASTMVISAINALTLTPSRAVAVFKTETLDEHGHPRREALPWWLFGLIGGFASVWVARHYLAAQLGLPADPHAGTGDVWRDWLIWLGLFIPGLLVGGLLGWLIIRPVNAVLALVFRAFNWVFDRITAIYGWTVGRSVRLAALVLLIYGGLLGLTGWSLVRAPKGFIPIQDQGYLLANVQLPDSASLERTQAIMNQLARIALGDDKYRGPPPAEGEPRHEGVPGIAHSMTVAGLSVLLGSNGSNLGSAFIILDPYDQRHGHERYDEVVAQKLRRLFAEEIDDAVVSVFRAPPIQGLGNAGGFKLQVEQRGFVDLQELQTSTDDLVRAANQDKRLIGVFSMYRAQTPQIFLDIDRTKCESLAVDIQDVFNTLQVYLGGYYVNLFNEFGRTWQVNLLAAPRFRTDASIIRQLKVRSKTGHMVALQTLCRTDETGGPILVGRYNMYITAAVNGGPAPGVSSGEAIDAITQIADRLGVPFEWTEVTYLQILAGGAGMLVFVVGGLLVYLVLAAKYESWRLPLAVVMVVPLCVLCAVAGMTIAHLPIDIFVQIGLLVLIGLAAKNAILIVEFTQQLEVEGLPRREAVVQAAKLRFRPIVMTSFAFILGVLPLVLGHGAGAEMRRALGTAVFSGMLGVTVFGVFLTPVFYYAVLWFGPQQMRGRGSPVPSPTPARDHGHAPPGLPASEPAHGPSAPIPSSSTPGPVP